MSRFIRSQRLGAIPAAASPALPVDSVLTDPPYLCNYRDRTGRTVANDNDPAWLKPAFAEIARVMCRNAFCVSFYGWQEVDRFMEAWRSAGLRPVGHLVFAKRYASSSRYVGARHESAFLLARGRPPLPRTVLPDVLPRSLYR